MLKIEIDGKALEVQGGTVMEAANQVGIYIPHFCYHKKLSIAANCRMCLVDVEKAPKPLPACATPVTDGMKVHTHSATAVTAQKGVMEFLLINHPLDCPICDQGGECQLQDLAVGYGGFASRYAEDKRVVPNKDLGPLISTDMTRCIHCTRCVRFTEEIAGWQELGMAGRGEHSEIMPFLETTVNSELSGNVIDLCPVGALTSKPFRYSARSWELSRRRSVSPHDGLGANLTVQVMGGQVKRVLPLENEDINECWLADRDRYSYEALASGERLQKPMLKQDGKWIEVDWSTALEYVSHGVRDIIARHGKDSVGALASPQATVEELFVLRKLLGELGVNHIDTRLRQSDFRADKVQTGPLWLGSTLAQLQSAKSVLLIGSQIRKEEPLIAHRLRQAVKKGSQLHVINAADDDLLCKVASKQIVSPQQFVATLKALSEAVVALKGGKPVAGAAGLQAQALLGEGAVLLLGHQALHHPDFALLLEAANALAASSGATLSILAEGANSIGAWLAGAHPHLSGGKNSAQMLDGSSQALFLLHAEAEFDFYDPQRALTAASAAAMVVALSPFKHGALDYADVLLPVAPWTETAGSFVNLEGKLQSFNGTVPPLGETRPAWKVFRVLGNLLNLPGFNFNSVEDIRAEAVVSHLDQGVLKGLSNALRGPVAGAAQLNAPLVRLGEVPVYQVDGITRRAPSLQATVDAQTIHVGVPKSLAAQMELADGDKVKVCHGLACISLPAAIDPALAEGALRLAAASARTLGLAGLYDPITIERV